MCISREFGRMHNTSTSKHFVRFILSSTPLHHIPLSYISLEHRIGKHANSANNSTKSFVRYHKHFLKYRNYIENANAKMSVSK